MARRRTEDHRHPKEGRTQRVAPALSCTVNVRLADRLRAAIVVARRTRRWSGGRGDECDLCDDGKGGPGVDAPLGLVGRHEHHGLRRAVEGGKCAGERGSGSAGAPGGEHADGGELGESIAASGERLGPAGRSDPVSDLSC